MRGKVSKNKHQETDTRITPAYAGKRDFVKRNLFVTQDHPRLCGEKVPPVLIVRKFQGSPPPMRGKARLPFCKFLPIRITPAYAGKRTSSRQTGSSYEDHPRLCGEKCTYFHRLISSKGSPPPMRGKAYENKANSVTLRITPAYAGKSSNRVYISDRHRDHPRLCGEKNL